MPTEKASAYAKFSENYCGSTRKSWRNWFYVVKKNGWGNFHNLINLSNEWVVALLEKELTDQKTVNLKPYLQKLPQPLAKKVQTAVEKIAQIGDKVFDDKRFVEEVLKLPTKAIVPIFVHMLNIQETGRHENCTFFAFLLKIAKRDRALVLQETERAATEKSTPYYYLYDLRKKLRKS